MKEVASLGKRDIFGILLPGTIPILIVTFGIYSWSTLLGGPGLSFLHSGLLASVLLLTAAYLVGGVLRFGAADSLDRRSSDSLLRRWRAETTNRETLSYSECREALARGDTPESVPAGFDDWLWRADTFPYPAWMSRKWQVYGFNEILRYFRKHHRACMWLAGGISPKAFFNHCKLVVAKNDPMLADEIGAVEGRTRFFAGTVAALRVSVCLAAVILIGDIAIVVASAFVDIHGVEWSSSVWTPRIFYLALTVALVGVLVCVYLAIVRSFRLARLKEVETVYHAFYLASTGGSGT